jgi:hypothetical protein
MLGPDKNAIHDPKTLRVAVLKRKVPTVRPKTLRTRPGTGVSPLRYKSTLTNSMGSMGLGTVLVPGFKMRQTM